MNIDPGYVPYDPYIPHTPEEIKEYNEQVEKIKRERELKKIIRNNFSQIEKTKTIKYHTAGQKISDPLKSYKEITYVDNNGNILLKEKEYK